MGVITRESKKFSFGMKSILLSHESNNLECREIIDAALVCNQIAKMEKDDREFYNESATTFYSIKKLICYLNS